MFDPATGRFNYNRDNQLECELLIVDEISMLDIILAYQLFQAIPAGCSVVLVGDSDQLPSVGPGKVLADLMECGFFGVTRLTRIFRQSGNSAIIHNAHRVNAGLLPEKPDPGADGLTDFYWIEQEDPAKAADIIARLASERIPAKFGFDPIDEIQILSPMNRGNCGTAELNAMLAEILNSQKNTEMHSGDRRFKVNDKVMQITNNYDKMVFNGDMGRIKYINPQTKRFSVAFDNGEHLVDYTFDEAIEIVPAYAITIHKSQGSEFPAVIVPIMNQHFLMLRRNLVYTAMTRAKKLLILIGGRKTIEMAVRDSRVEPRISLLGEKLRELKQIT
jgi:exodeoxyribonuclease V alpha subunit